MDDYKAGDVVLFNFDGVVLDECGEKIENPEPQEATVVEGAGEDGEILVRWETTNGHLEWMFDLITADQIISIK